MAHKEFIVAIDLGSSKVVAVAGRKNLDSSITVLSVVKEPSSSFIRNGVVYNMDKTISCISNIINKMQTQLKTKITKVYVGISGQSVHGEKNVIIHETPQMELITDAVINELHETNRQMDYPGQYVLDSIEQEYKVDNSMEMFPVGVQCRHLEANFLNIICREMFYKNLNDCFEKAGVTIAELRLSPSVLAESVLLESEKRSGCMLVDIGADITTIAVYSKNILRHIIVIPLGSANITKDLASYPMDEDEAEQLKIKYGTAYSEDSNPDEAVTYKINQKETISSTLFNEIVESRMREIIENVNHQIPANLHDGLLGGIILTGGGSNIKDIERAFIQYTQIQKVRVAKFVQQSVTTSSAEINSHNGMYNTVLALIADGTMNCAGGEYDPNEQLFSEDGEPMLHLDGSGVSTEKREGVVMTQAQRAELEKKQKEEEIKRQEEKAAAEEAQRKAEEEERMQRKQNNVFKRFGRKMGKWFDNIIGEEN